MIVERERERERESYTLAKQRDKSLDKDKGNIKLKTTITIAVIFAALAIIFVICMANNIGNIQNIFGIKRQQEEEEILPLISYQIYDNKDKENVKVLVTFNSEDGIEYIKKSDGEIINVNGKNTLGIDYILPVQVEEPIIIKEVGKQEITEKLQLTGIGTEEFPVIIMNANQLLNIQKNTDKLFKDDIPRNGIHYKIGANIDLSETEWTPIGTTEKPFEGILDGNSKNYTISNLIYSNEEITNAGLFGYSTGTLKNIKLDNCEVAGKDNVGVLVGNNIGKVNNIEVKNAKVNGINNVGGVVGYTTNNSISNSTANAIVSGNENVGGLIGNSSYGTSLIFENNKSSGSVTGKKNVGGIMGYFYNNSGTFKINNSYSTANVNATEDNAGGIIGNCRNDSQLEIYQCYTTGKIKTLKNNVGSIIGILDVRSSNKIYDNFTLSDISGEDYCGGLIGKTEYLGSRLEISKNYVCGNLERKQGNIGAFVGIPGYVNNNISIEKNNYYVPEIEVLDLDLQGTRKEISKMFTQSEFAEWNFDDVWIIEEGLTIPYLKNVDKPNEVNKNEINKKGIFTKQLAADEQSVTIGYSTTKEIQNVTINGENAEIIHQGENYAISKVLTEGKQYEIIVTTTDGEVKTIRYVPEELLRTGENVSIFGSIETAAVNGTNLYEYAFKPIWNYNCEYRWVEIFKMGAGRGSDRGGWKATFNWDYLYKYKNIEADELEVNAKLWAPRPNYAYASSADFSVTVNFVDGTSETQSAPTNSGGGSRNEIIKIPINSKKISSIIFTGSGYDDLTTDSYVIIEDIILKNTRVSP